MTEQTLELLNNEYLYESGTENAKNDAFLVRNNIKTFLISPTFNACEEAIVINALFFIFFNEIN